MELSATSHHCTLVLFQMWSSCECQVLVQKLEGKSGISIMADRGFTVKDQLQEIGVDLNHSSFFEG